MFDTPHITAITEAGPRPFSKYEIQEMLDNMDDYWLADNLPKWLFASGFTANRKDTIKLLKIFIKNDPRTIDVRY